MVFVCPTQPFTEPFTAIGRQYRNIGPVDLPARLFTALTPSRFCFILLHIILSAKHAHVSTHHTYILADFAYLCYPSERTHVKQGLPEDWLQAEATPERFKKGTFSLDGQFPEVEDNVILVKGLFADTLPPFLAAHEQHAGETLFRGTFALRAYSTAAVPFAISGSPLMFNKVLYALNI